MSILFNEMDKRYVKPGTPGAKRGKRGGWYVEEPSGKQPAGKKTSSKPSEPKPSDYTNEDLRDEYEAISQQIDAGGHSVKDSMWKRALENEILNRGGDIEDGKKTSPKPSGKPSDYEYEDLRDEYEAYLHWRENPKEPGNR